MEAYRSSKKDNSLVTFRMEPDKFKQLVTDIENFSKSMYPLLSWYVEQSLICTLGGGSLEPEANKEVRIHS